MNTDNLNKSQVIEMMLRIEDIRDNLLKNKTVYERYHGDYAYLWNLVIRLGRLLHSFGDNYTLCAYCNNSLDHNLGDHKLAVERQKITDVLYEEKFYETVIKPSLIIEYEITDES